MIRQKEECFAQHASSLNSHRQLQLHGVDPIVVVAVERDGGESICMLLLLLLLVLLLLLELLELLLNVRLQSLNGPRGFLER